MATGLVDIECEIRNDDPTKKAIAVVNGTMEQTDRGEREKWYWLPRSMVQDNGDGTIAMPTWLAAEKGLI